MHPTRTPDAASAAPPTTTSASTFRDTPEFTRTVDVLELVCEAVGFSDTATLLALRACSTACLDAVSGAVRRVCAPEDATHPWASDEMAPSVARIPRAARLCVVTQANRWQDGDWLRVVPPTVLRANEPRRMLADVKTLLAYVPRPRSITFERNGPAVTRAVIDAVATAAAPTLESFSVNRATGFTAAAVSRIAALPNLTSLSLAHNAYSQVRDDNVIPLIQTLTKLVDLDLSGNEGKVTDATLEAIATHLPQLKALRLARAGSGISERGISAVARGCPELEAVDLLFGRQSVTDAAVEAIAEHCPRLQSLNVSWCDITDRAIHALTTHRRRAASSADDSAPTSPLVPKTMPGTPNRAVTKPGFSIQVSDTNGGVTGDALVALAEASGGLSELNVTGTMGAVTDAHLAAIAEASTDTLEVLKAASDTRLSDAGIAAVASRCPNLTSLDIGWSSGRITDEAITAVAKNCKKLRELNVSHTSGLTSDTGILAVASHCKDLESLSSCVTYGDVTDTGLTAIAKGCPRLVALDVSHTQGKISDDTVRAIAHNCPRFAKLGCTGVKQHWSADAMGELAASCPAFASTQ